MGLKTSMWAACALRSIASFSRRAPSLVLVAPRVVERPEERGGTGGVPDLPELADPVGEQVAPPANPPLPVGREEEPGALRGRGVRQRHARLLLEPAEAALAEAGVGHVRDGLLPARVGVVVVEPHAVHLELPQELPEGVHPAPAVGLVRGADPLPPVRRRRHAAVRPDGRGVGMVLQVVGDVQRVELGEDAHLLGPEKRHPLGREAARPHPDGVDPELGQAAARVEDLLRDAPVDPAHRDVGTGGGVLRGGGGRAHGARESDHGEGAERQAQSGHS